MHKTFLLAENVILAQARWRENRKKAPFTLTK